MEKKNNKTLLYTAAVILMLITIRELFFYAPVPALPMHERGPQATDAQWNNEVYSYYIAYFHIPIALSTYLAFLLVFVYSILFLRDRQLKWDIKAVASAEVGVIFAGLTLITGSIWAKATWGHFWPPGDIRLNTSLVLFFIYIAYLMIRQAVDSQEKQARFSAIFGIIGFISVPISFLSIRLWSAAYHPTVVGSKGGGITGHEVILPLMLNLLAFMLMCISLIIFKVDNLTLQEELMNIKQQDNVH